MLGRIALFIIAFIVKGGVEAAISAPVQSSSSIQTQAKNQQSTSQSQNNEIPDEGQIAAWKIEAAQAAQNYVNLLDKERYAESWMNGSSIFQRTISQKEWVVALDLARKRLGKVISRTLKDDSPSPRWDPKGLPKGPYMVVQYNTSFEKAPHSGELLTLRLEPDGHWKVLTYQVN